MSEVELGPRDAVLVFTPRPQVRRARPARRVRTDAGYIGALGSRQTTADRERAPAQAGANDADIARIHAPCGLDIGSRTAEETAVSVLAEIIASRTQRAAAPLRKTTGPIHGRLDQPVPSIGRASPPRSPGTNPSLVAHPLRRVAHLRVPGRGD